MGINNLKAFYRQTNINFCVVNSLYVNKKMFTYKLFTQICLREKPFSHRNALRFSYIHQFITRMVKTVNRKFCCEA